MQQGEVVLLDRLQGEVSVAFQVGVHELEGQNVFGHCGQTQFEVLYEGAFHELQTESVAGHALQQKRLFVP